MFPNHLLLLVFEVPHLQLSVDLHFHLLGYLCLAIDGNIGRVIVHFNIFMVLQGGHSSLVFVVVAVSLHCNTVNY